MISDHGRNVRSSFSVLDFHYGTGKCGVVPRWIQSPLRSTIVGKLADIGVDSYLNNRVISDMNDISTIEIDV